MTTIERFEAKFTSPFDRWWSELPSEMKQSKQLAIRHWNAIWRNKRRWSSQDGMADYFIERIKEQVEHGHFESKRGDGTMFYPHGSTWLSYGRFDDEVVKKASARPVERQPNRLLSEHERARLRR